MKINHENDSHAIPFDKVLEAVNFMRYGSDVSVMFQMLFITGCRMRELDKMRASAIMDGWLYWKLGKKQTTHRKIELLPKFIKELDKYRETNRTYSDKLFGISCDTFRRYFNRDVRPHLSAAWQEERISNFHGPDLVEKEYVLQIKGLRKDFQTLRFKKELDKWKDSGVALEFTCKEMRHKSKKITAYHYLENFDSLGVNKYSQLTTADILQANSRQSRIMDFIKSI